MTPSRTRAFAAGLAFVGLVACAGVDEPPRAPLDGGGTWLTAQPVAFGAGDTEHRYNFGPSTPILYTAFAWQWDLSGIEESITSISLTASIPIHTSLSATRIDAADSFSHGVVPEPSALLLSFAALAVTILYPFTKRWVSMPQAVLGVAFSFGIPMAFSAALGGREWSLQAIAASVPLSAWGLLAANLFWVLAYDTEYAMVDRDDDIRIGIKTSALTLGRFDVIGVMAFYVVFLALWAALGLRLGMGHWFLAGLAAAAAQVVWHYTLIKDRGRDGCFKAFRENHWVGFAIFAGTVLDLALR